MKRIFLTILVLMLCAPFAFAAEPPGGKSALTDSFIKYRQVGWQTYEFSLITNLVDNGDLNVEWTVDSLESFTAPRLHYFFTSGVHNIRVKVEDKFGNVKYDKVKLHVAFWSLSNNWFWWIFYLLLVFIVLYYWIAKIIYLLNRRHINRQVRYFLDALDEYGWVEQTIAEISKNRK